MELTVARMCIESGPGAMQLTKDLSVSGNLSHRDEKEQPSLQHPSFPLKSPVLCIPGLHFEDRDKD